MRKNYPSDISREQFEKIRPILGSVDKKYEKGEKKSYSIVVSKMNDKFPLRD